MGLTEQELGYSKAAPGRRSALRDCGFTLVEILIVVAIAAVLLTVGVPSFTSSITLFRVSTEVNGLVGDLQYARSEAVKQGTTVTMCVSANGTTCVASPTWASGHIVTVIGATPLRVQAALGGTDTVTPSNGTTLIAFNREGFAGTSTGWNAFAMLAQPLILAVQDQANATRSCVLVSKVGQISVVGRGAAGAGWTC